MLPSCEFSTAAEMVLEEFDDDKGSLGRVEWSKGVFL
jgi:hypothetical protein